MNAMISGAGRRVRGLAALCAAGTLLLGGCTMMTPGERQGLRTELAELRIEQGRLREAHNEWQQKVLFQLEEIDRKLSDQDKQLDAMRTDLETQLVRLREGLGQSPVAGGGRSNVVTTPYAGGETGDEPGDATLAADQMRAAQEAFSRGEYDEALSAYRDFLQAWPQAPRAAEALFGVGSCHYYQKNYAEARQAFDRVVDEFPGSPWVPKALHSRALSEYQMNDTEAARSTLETLRSLYPDYETERIEALLEELS